MRRPLLYTTGLLAATAAAYLLLWPVPVDPVAWSPPPRPADDAQAYQPLSGVQRVLEGVGPGPEDVALDSNGRIYTGTADGRIAYGRPQAPDPTTLVNTGGRPLGMDIDPTGGVVVADAVRGLLSVSPEGELRVLAAEEGGLPFRFLNDVDVAADGTVYFSDSSHRHGPAQFREAIIEHRPRGRLLAYDPRSGAVTKLMGDLHFANGVAVSPDGSFVLVVETGAYRVMRYRLEGPDAGRVDVFADNLPGFPDGISSNGRDTFWLALYAPRSAALDALMPRPFLRKVLLRMPESLLPEPPRQGLVLGLDGDGRMRHALRDPSGAYAPVTSVEQHGDWLYLGSLLESAVGRVPVPDRR